jgi:hypothetical protein
MTKNRAIASNEIVLLKTRKYITKKSTTENFNASKYRRMVIPWIVHYNPLFLSAI